MSKILANQIANYLDNAPIEIKEGLNIPTGKPLQVNGSIGTNGQVLSTDGSGLVWADAPYFDGDYNNLTNQPTIPAAQVNSDWNVGPGDVRHILNKPVVPPQPSVTTAPAPSGLGSLTYNTSNGEFTFTQPDLSSYIQTETDPVFLASDAAAVTAAKIANWDTSFSWGNHAAQGYITPTGINVSQLSASGGGSLAYDNGTGTLTYRPPDLSGYLTAESDTLATVTARGAVTTANVTVNDMVVNGNLTVIGTTTSNNQSTLNVAATEIVINDGQSGAPTLNGSLKIDRGSATDTAIRWNEGTDIWEFTNDGTTYNPIPTNTNQLTNGAGFLTSYTETDPVFSGSPAGSITNTNVTNWNTAYGWGNHAGAGYLTAEADTLDTITARGNTTNNGITVGGITVNGNMTVNGTQTVINTAILQVSDNEITLNNDVTGTPTENAGIEVERGLSTNVRIRWDETADRWQFTNNGSNYYNIPTQISDLTNDSGYITTFVETDPIFTASPASAITTTELGQWNAAYNWGDHAQAGYLTSLGDAAGVTTAKITNWDTAFGWGDHSTAGYLTAEADTLDTVTGRGSATTNEVSVGKLTVDGAGNGIGKFEIADNGNYSSLTWYDSLGNPGPNIQGVSSNIYMNVAGGHVRVGGQGTIFYGDGNISLNATSPVNSTTTFFNGFDISAGNANLATNSKITFGSSGVNQYDIYANGSNLIIGNEGTNTAGDIYLYTDTFIVGKYDGTGTMAMFHEGAQCELYYDSLKKLETTSDGVTVSGDLRATEYIGVGRFDGSGNLTLTQDNLENSVISHLGTGSLTLKTNNNNGILIWADDTGSDIILRRGTGVGVVNRLATTSTGVTFTGDIEFGSGDLTTTGKLYYSNNFATTGDLPNATTYHGMFAHVHAEGHGYFAHGGAWTQLLDTGSSLGELADVDLSVAPTTGQVLKYNGTNWAPAADSGGSGSGIELTDLSVVTDSPDTAALSYNSSNGVFTFTPPDLSGYAETANLNTSNWDTAYAWGDHASEGYLTSYTETDTLDTVTGRGSTTANTIQVGQINIGSGSQSILPSGSNDVEFRNTFTGGAIRLRAAGNVEISSYQGSTLLKTDTGSVTTGGLSLYYATGLTTEVVRLTTTSTGVTINGVLTAGGLTYPNTNGTNGQVLTSDGAGNVTWTPAGGGATTLGGLTDVDTTTVPPSGGEVLYYDASNTSWLPIPYQLGSLNGVDLTTTPPTNGQTLVYNSSNNLWEPGSAGGGGSSLQSRTTSFATTAVIANDAAADITIVAEKTYVLHKIQTSAAAWVTLYTDTSSRTNDASRTENTDPTPGSGVIAEVITTTGTTQPITPGTIGWNNDGTPSRNAYLKVVNKSGSSTSITVTLHYVQLEA